MLREQPWCGNQVKLWLNKCFMGWLSLTKPGTSGKLLNDSWWNHESQWIVSKKLLAPKISYSHLTHCLGHWGMSLLYLNTESIFFLHNRSRHFLCPNESYTSNEVTRYSIVIHLNLTSYLIDIFSWMMEKNTQLSEDFMADQLWGLSILFQWQENVIERVIELTFSVLWFSKVALFTYAFVFSSAKLNKNGTPF